MQDKYFKTGETKEDLISALGLDNSHVVAGCGGDYLQTSDFILYWVGKIPIYDENGELSGYEADGASHFNIRPITGYPNFGDLEVTEINPSTPYAVFQ